MLKVLIHSPYKTNTGYGYKSRDFIRAFIKVFPQYDTKLFNKVWNHSIQIDVEDLDELLVTEVKETPDLFIHIGLPNEMQFVGKKNILVTAGTEVSKIPNEWYEYLNKCDLVIVPSKFTKSLLPIKVRTEVLFEGYNHKIVPQDVNLDIVEEDFCFLYVGQFMNNGAFSQDRKNLGNTIVHFLETFKNKKKKPALIIKSQMGSCSKADYYTVYEYINSLKELFKKDSLPNIYLLHGELSDEEMFGLYNHPKVKAMVSLTRGEGFGRPLLEFATTNKPIIVSKHSGHLDFLGAKTTNFVNGKMVTIHPNAVWSAMPQDSKWFEPNYNEYKKHLVDVFENYNEDRVKRDWGRDLERFSMESMERKLKEILYGE